MLNGVWGVSAESEFLLRKNLPCEFSKYCDRMNALYWLKWVDFWRLLHYFMRGIFSIIKKIFQKFFSVLRKKFFFLKWKNLQKNFWYWSKKFIKKAKDIFENNEEKDINTGDFLKSDLREAGIQYLTLQS